MNTIKLFLFRLFAGPYKKRLFRHTAGAEAELVLLSKFLKLRQPHFIDVGANKGELVYVASRQLPAQKIWAIEPLPYFARKLKALFSGIRVSNCVLSDQEGYTQFFLPVLNGVPDDSLASVNRPDKSAYEIFDVAVRTLDSLTAGQNLRAETFLKIDVEGHEFAVLHGGMKFISAHVAAMLIEIEERHHGGKPLAELIAPVEEMGFSCYYLHPGKRLLTAFSAEPLVFQRTSDLNTPAYVNNFWFFAKHLDVTAVVASLNNQTA